MPGTCCRREQKISTSFDLIRAAPTYKDTRHVGAIIERFFADLEEKVAVTLDDAELGVAVESPPLIDGDGLYDSVVFRETTPGVA